MDANIILRGQQADILGSYDRGQQAGARSNEIKRQNSLADLYRTKGADIIAGDQGAINALAGLSPDAAMAVQGNRQQMQARDLGMQSTRLGMEQTKQSMAISAEKMQMLREKGAQEALRNAQSMSADQLEAERKKLEAGLSGAAFFYQKGDRQGYDNFLRQQGIDPAQVPFDQFEAQAAVYSGALEALKEFEEMNGSQQDGFRVATPEEAARYGSKAGQIDAKTGRFYPINPPKGSSIEVGPDGTVRIIEGAGVGGSNEASVGDVYDPSGVDETVGLIDSILTDPALPKVVGPLEGGGGNDVGDLNVMKRAYYGGDGLAVIQKIAQVQSRGWLAARKMLKGGGAITDYESRKAEGAVARMERAQSEGEFKAALTEFRDAIVAGKSKIDAARGGSVTPPSQPSDGLPDFESMSDEELRRLAGEDQ